MKMNANKKLGKLLTEYDYNFLRQKYENMKWASQNGHLEVVKYIVSIGCDPKAGDNLAIRYASQNGHLEVVKYLVEVGCDPTAKDNYSIHYASQYGHLEVVKYLLELGCDYEDVRKDIKYEVLQECKINLRIFTNKRIGNKYLQMEILKKIMSQYTEYEIMSLL